MARIVISIDKLQPGMKLAKAVINESGMILVAENTELTEGLIRRLERMNIESVSIAAEAKPAKSAEEMLAELEVRFRKTGNDLHMGMLKSIFQEHIRKTAQ